MQDRTYAMPHNLNRLSGDIQAAFPELQPVPGPNGVLVATMLLSGDGLQFTIGLPDDFDPLRLDPVLAAHDPTPDPPPAFRYLDSETVSVVLRTTDDTETTAFVLAAQPKSVYRGELQMNALDAGNGVCKFMAGILVWKRLLGANVIAPPGNITVLSDIHDTAAASWVMNGLPAGGSFRIFVKGAPGRTIDWALAGAIARYAPAGLDG